MIFEKIKLYPEREDVTLTAYILDDSIEMQKGRRRPAVLICPGGAYVTCSDREGEPVAMAFASMGYHAFVLRYSVSGLAVYPSQMREIGMSILKMRERADEWKLDPEKIILCGFSAGGHNAAMYGNCWNRPIVTEALRADASDLKPAAQILGYPVCDYLGMKDNFGREMEASAKLIFEQSAEALFGNREITDELLREGSPSRNVSSSTPPTFLWSTCEDELVPIRNSVMMADALAQNGIPFEMHIFEKGGHGLSLSTQASAGNANEIRPDTDQWIRLADAWLMKRFSLFHDEPFREEQRNSSLLMMEGMEFPEGYYSVKDTLKDIMNNPKTRVLVQNISGAAAGPGEEMKMDSGIGKMMGWHPLYTLLEKAGSHISKEQVLNLNQKLNDVRKEL
ncbi:MAG TPA: alpha/beta hydrolase [Lachnospiraceae bacterium]|nr:alpha/beta hydrolase [Lachnospiraceae bacterium]